jgi:hypothetical protein
MNKMRATGGLMVRFLLALVFNPALASGVPTLLHTAGYQSPRRGAPDELLLLAGYGLRADDVVVYQATGDAVRALRPPAAVPLSATAELGVVPIASSDDVPYALTLRLPGSMTSERPYSLWVRTAAGEWSQPVLINNSRPLWLSPARVYATSTIGSLPRYLKVIGHNLRSQPGGVTELRLKGPATYIMRVPAGDAGTSPSRYVARAPLPLRLLPGHYRLQLRRDGGDWVDLPEQQLEVQADPAPKPGFRIDAPEYGGCVPNDGRDDTPCLRRAVAQAALIGGTVLLGAGEWTLGQAGAPPADSLLLPSGVDLQGAGNRATTVMRSAAPRATGAAALILSGHNTVRDIAFRDARVYRAGDGFVPMLQLGAAGAESALTDIVIADNRFAGTHPAISDANRPIRRLFVVGNEFGSYSVGLELSGSRFNVRSKFELEDTVIAHNTFKPGSFIDLASGQGAMASELGAGHRVDFSDNVADGSASEYLYAAGDPAGWRAAFFWHLNNNQEQVLIADNIATCTGDKDGDGEAIALDNNGNVFALDTVNTVRAGAATSVTVDGPLVAKQYDQRVDPPSYYIGDWVHVLRGPGVGQARRIVGYEVSATNGRAAFKVAPAWDVIPVAGQSGLSIGRQFWQVYVLHNHIDNRSPLCRKSNRTAPKAGAISLWAQMTDSVVAGNRQYDSDGIVLQTLYNAPEPGCKDCRAGVFFNSAVEIRDNEMEGEYRFESNCSSSGIFVSLGASPGADPVTASFGLEIAHNAITGADARGGGAIAVQPTWYAGPDPHRWPLVSNLLIQKNQISGLDAPRASACGREAAPVRAAIVLPRFDLAWHTAIHANSCPARMLAIVGRRPTTRVLCDAGVASCSCPP